jgi:hypothetical protein
MRRAIAGSQTPSKRPVVRRASFAHLPIERISRIACSLAIDANH